MVVSLYDPVVDNVLKASPSTVSTSSGVQFPYPFPSPADWRDHWIYFLLVDRFDNPAAPPQPDEYPCNVYQGGTFAGIKRRLPYLKRLGAGAIWLSPVLMNPAWFGDYWGGYGVLDFLRIEPRFCTDVNRARRDSDYADHEFRDLVDEAHAHEIYVVLDIVLNHVGDLFNYEGMLDAAPWNASGEYTIYWRNQQGTAQGTWTDVANIPNLPREAGVWPSDFQRNDYFRRRGKHDVFDPSRGDFDRLKELVTEYLVPGTEIFPVRNLLIRAYQYLIAKFDLDGFRIDTLQYVEPEFARVFGNAMREYALSIGKKNFFTFGEVWEDNDEDKIAEFVGRNTQKGDEIIGVDAAIDFPMRKRLWDVSKALAKPAVLASHFDCRRETLKKITSSHGDAGRYYVTFIENHDLNKRFHNAQYPSQTKLALTCLMTMQGIPCIYYGMEQGLTGEGNRREYVREALWGRQNAFSQNHDLYQLIQQLSGLRSQHPALRYGRQYFRACSGDGIDFAYSPYPGGVLAFSRILNDREILIVANTNVQQKTTVHVVVDANLNPVGSQWGILFSTDQQPAVPALTAAHGVYHTLQVTLAPMEVQVLT
jgi:glycosidase